MKKKNRNQLLVSIVGTTIGVLLAFILSNWNSNRIQKIESRRILSKIINEVELNNEILENSYNVSVETAPSLSKLVLNYEKDEKIIMSSQDMKKYQTDFPNKFIVSDSINTEEKNIFEYKGRYDFNPDIFVHFSLKKSAWNSAIAVGMLNNIEFEKIKDLEEIYSMQKQVIKQSEKLINTFDIGMKEYVKVLNNLLQYEELLLIKIKDWTEKNKN